MNANDYNELRHNPVVAGPLSAAAVGTEERCSATWLGGEKGKEKITVVALPVWVARG
jgi:hypothetical protein